MLPSAELRLEFVWFLYMFCIGIWFCWCHYNTHISGSRSLGLSLSLSLSLSHSCRFDFFPTGMVRIIPLTNETLLSLQKDQNPYPKYLQFDLLNETTNLLFLRPSFFTFVQTRFPCMRVFAPHKKKKKKDFWKIEKWKRKEKKEKPKILEAKVIDIPTGKTHSNDTAERRN